jgi:hypothetical protein
MQLPMPLSRQLATHFASDGTHLVLLRTCTGLLRHHEGLRYAQADQEKGSLQSGFVRWKITPPPLDWTV